jgi:hypothetical protein
MICPAVWQKFADMSEKHSASIFRVEEKSKHATNRESYPFDVDSEGNMFP